MKRSAQPRLVAALDIDPAVDEAEFERWYDEEHVAERMRCPGFIAATRLRSSASPRYVTIYELASDAALDTPEYRSLIKLPADLDDPDRVATDMTRRMVGAMRVAVRGVYDVVYEAAGERPDA